jgi:hypothetical protein
MKKISTVGRQRIRNCSELKQAMGKLTIGLDLGDRSSWYCVLENYAGRGINQKHLWERKNKNLKPSSGDCVNRLARVPLCKSRIAGRQTGGGTG